jgi:putative polyketide hydroxylase
LLQTYQTERRQVSQSITSQSLKNSINVARIMAAARTGGDSGLSTEEVIATSRRYGNHLGVEFGAHYRSAAVVSDGTSPPAVADAYSDYVPSATPGCRAPHVWLGDDLSTLELITGFTLLAARGGQAWIEQARACADTFDLPIGAYRIGSAGLADAGGTFVATYGLSGSGAVLIRPDGHVAWRGAGEPGSHDDLARVLRQVLAL